MTGDFIELARIQRSGWGALLFPDGELRTGDPEAPPLAFSRKGQRGRAVRENLGLGGLHSAGLGAGLGVSAKQVVDVRDLGELPPPVVDLRLAERDAAAFQGKRNAHGLAVVAGDG